jgi:tetratricopeptide (TPR) repeat protein
VSDPQINRMLAAADDMRRRHNWNGAIETLRRALTIDPNHARAHASLALALLGARRLPAAALEAGAALAEDAHDRFCHLAMAYVRSAERKLDDAWQHALIVLQEEADVDARILAASIADLRDDLDEAREQLGHALELEPESAAALRTLARLELRLGDHDEAARLIERALRASPDAAESHVVAGHVALARGEVGEAEGHARFALRADAVDPDTLALVAAIKARKSKLLGVWWRWNVWISQRGSGRQVGILIGTYVIAQLAIILAGALGDERLESALGYLWLGVCAYTWIAPAWFRRAIARELEQVQLRDDY